MTSTELDKAVANGKLRLRWSAGPVEETVRAQLIEALWRAVRERMAPPGTSQDEQLDVRIALAEPTGGWRVEARYAFDHDFASQYDAVERVCVALRVPPDASSPEVERWEPETD